MTTPFGADAASGDQVSIADFSSFANEGSGYTLKVGNDVSHPFDIAGGIYRKLKYQALAYFYHNRSGIALKMPFVGESQWARPAGHVDVPPNKGDKKVPCAPDSGCTYALDVSGGWYDAGDHGKYVVNAGVSVWTLLNQWERAKHLGTSAADFGDGKLNIPEKENGAPDLLDEVRWELEFELRMQVPANEKLAGMVHHKVHDKAWTALGLAPARRSHGAAALRPEHGGHPEHGREHRAGGARVAWHRQGVLRAMPGGGGARLGGGPGESRHVRQAGRRGRRALRRPERHR